MKDFDDRTAIFLAAVCSQTYAQFNDAEGRYVIPEFYEQAASFSAKSITGQMETFGFILESKDRIIIAFRGTSTTTDWISDAIAIQSNYRCVPNSGKSHKGMSDIYYSARKAILSSLDKLPAHKKLMITGHSLGGALATLCAVDVAANSPFRLPSVYTYGSPRVGDPTFSKVYANKVDQSYRINNFYDVVPHLPPHVYKLPKSDKTHHYMHVRESVPLHFYNGSVSENHLIGSYYTELAKRNPEYAKQLRRRNPGFCPAVTVVEA